MRAHHRVLPTGHRARTLITKRQLLLAAVMLHAHAIKKRNKTYHICIHSSVSGWYMIINESETHFNNDPNGLN